MINIYSECNILTIDILYLGILKSEMVFLFVFIHKLHLYFD